MDYYYFLFMLLAFLAIVLLLEGAALAWNASRGPAARQIQRRLRAMSGGAHQESDISIVKQRLLCRNPAISQLLAAIPGIQMLDQFLLQSGTSLNVARFLGMCVVAALAGFFLAVLARFPLLMALAVAVAAGGLPFLYILRSKRKRLARIEEQLPDALDLIARALRAGHAFPGALQLAATETRDPIARELRIAFDETNFGVSMQDALLNLAARVPCTDLRYFVTSVLIQRETGGNLSEVLDNISLLVRTRFKTMGKIRALAAEGKLSAWILTLMPFCVALAIYAVNPTFLGALWTDPAGPRMIAAALVLMVIGIFWMWRTIRIRV